MLKKLEEYYRSQGILAKHFTCPHRANCSAGYSETFTGPKSAAVRTGYEDWRLPRLLFFSLDSGSGEREPEQRLPGAIRNGMEAEDINALPQNQHWFRTHELAWYILKQFDDELELQEVNHHFAHTNAAKCCQNRPDGKMADEHLFTNCRRYLAGEIRVLCPDVIVTQGQKARDGLQPILVDMREVDKFAWIARFDGRLIFWLHTYHPSPINRRRFYPQRAYDQETGRCEGWQRYAEDIRRFVDERNRGRP